jgi:hypothetical protein
MSSSHREQQILQALARELAKEDPDWVAQFDDGSTQQGLSWPPRWLGRLLATLWAPRSFLEAMLGVVLIATPLCLACQHLATLPTLAVFAVTLTFALCLVPMYRYLAICDKSRDDSS